MEKWASSRTPGSSEKRKKMCCLQEEDEVEEDVLELLRLREISEEEDEATGAPSPRSVRRTAARNDSAAASFSGKTL
jgi:hypothetical protein